MFMSRINGLDVKYSLRRLKEELNGVGQHRYQCRPHHGLHRPRGFAVDLAQVTLELRLRILEMQILRLVTARLADRLIQIQRLHPNQLQAE
jgi:hypothetical protein